MTAADRDALTNFHISTALWGTDTGFEVIAPESDLTPLTVKFRHILSPELADQ